MKIHTMIPENLYTMKNIAKIIQNPRKIILPFQEKVRNLNLNYPIYLPKVRILMILKVIQLLTIKM